MALSEELEEALKEFQQMTKEPIKKKGVTGSKPPVAAVSPTPVTVPVESPANGGSFMPVEMCFNKPFKKIVFQLPEEFIGQNKVKFWLLDLPECPEPPKEEG